MSDPSDDETTDRFQTEPGVVRWRMHFSSPPATVYRALATDEGRARYWAERTEESDGVVRFVVPGGHETSGRIIEAVPDRVFTVVYFGWTVRFHLASDGAGGTDLTMTSSDVPDKLRMEAAAGWVSVLMAMKAAVDHGVDLRNHDPERSWWQGYADN